MRGAVLVHVCGHAVGVAVAVAAASDALFSPSGKATSRSDCFDLLLRAVRHHLLEQLPVVGQLN
jgi:hypothetical protein